MSEDHLRTLACKIGIDDATKIMILENLCNEYFETYDGDSEDNDDDGAEA
jgi:hypothetical protein